MLDMLINLAVRRRQLCLLLCVVFCGFGLHVLSRLKIEAFPDVTNVQVMVIALYPGQAAEEVEKKVTIAVERGLVGVPQALSQRSITSFGLSQVIVTFEDDTDIFFARQQIVERLPTIDVPTGVSVELGPNDTPVGQIYQYTLESDAHTATEKRGVQEWVVRNHLMRVPGVADVVSFGGFQKEYHVLADVARLRANDLTLNDLTAAVDSSNEATSGGYIRHGQTEFVVRGRGYLSSQADIENTVVKASDGTPVLVKHVATVVQGYTPRRGGVARGMEIDSVEGTVLLRRGANPRDVLTGVHAAVDQINADVLPKGMRLVPFYDRTRLVDTTLKTVASNMVEGAVLVLLVIWLFLRTFVGSLAVASVMPLALLSAFIGLYYCGVPANLLSMGAIDFGILLDGAVILVENVFRHLGESNPPPEKVPETVAMAAREVVRPTLFSLCIIGAAMLPIFTLQRVEGRIFRPVALTYGFALLGALFFTLTCVPALVTVLLNGRQVREFEPHFLVVLRRVYLRCLRWVLNHPTPSRGFAVLLLGLALWTVPFLGTEFLPQMNEGDIHITITMPTTISLAEGGKILMGIRRDLLDFAEVAEVVTEQGHPEDGTDDEAPNQVKTFVMIKSPKDCPHGRTHGQLVEAMRERLEHRPGIAYNFSQPIKDRVEEAISGVRGQVVLKIFGEDLNLMHDKMLEVRNLLAPIVGARDVEVYRAGSAEHVVADIDRDAIARLGLAVRDVEDAIEGAFGGKLATQMWEGERKVGVRVKLPTPEEGDTHSVEQLLIPVGNVAAARIPLGSLAKVHLDRGRTQINREQLGRFLALKCNIEGRDMGTFVAEAQEKVAKNLVLPEGTYLTWGGEFENQRRAMRQLSIIVPISVGMIFALLYMTFNAMLPALVVLCGLPFAAVGGIFALLATHSTLSVSAAVGFITLFGVATMDGVLLITYVRAARQKHAQSGSPGERQEDILAAVSTRLRPVLMTALLASLGLLPAAMSHAIGSDTQRPFAIVIIGGLISSTLLTMLLLPSLYELFDGVHQAWGRRRLRSV
jgi:cobalt-zinc-cadmium resistance protein CzcA